MLNSSLLRLEMEEDTPPKEVDKQTEPVGDNIATTLENFFPAYSLRQGDNSQTPGI